MKLKILNFEGALKTQTQSFPLKIRSSQIKNTKLRKMQNCLTNSSFKNCNCSMNYVFLNKILQSPLMEEKSEKVVWE